MKDTEIRSRIQHTHYESSCDKNSEVNEEVDNDVVRYTLESYLGSHIGTSNEDKKQIAAEKISKLPKENFDELVGDIINEIHRRSEMAYDNTEKPMREKLVRLKDEKFKNLVYDVLQVFNNRHVRSSNSDIKDEIKNLSKLISILKVEEESTDSIVNENNEKLKVKLFIDYIKNFHNDKTVEYMENYIKDSITQDTDNSFDILFNYKVLLKKLDSSKYRKLREYQIHKSNIKRIEEMNIEKKMKKSLINKEYLNISELLLNKQYQFEELCIRNDVNHLINLFTRYNEKAYDYKEDRESFDIFTKDVARLIKNIADKAYTISYTNKELIFDLKTSANRSFAPESRSKYDEYVLEVTNKIRSLLENIQR